MNHPRGWGDLVFQICHIVHHGAIPFRFFRDVKIQSLSLQLQLNLVIGQCATLVIPLKWFVRLTKLAGARRLLLQILSGLWPLLRSPTATTTDGPPLSKSLEAAIIWRESACHRFDYCSGCSLIIQLLKEKRG